MNEVLQNFESGLASKSDSKPHRTGLSITFHQLRIFHAVVNAKTMTKAAKQLRLSQPSVSQQLSRLETIIGSTLFQRRQNRMELTEAGSYLLPKVEQLLRIMNEAEDELARFREGFQPVIRLAGINSVLRDVVPAAIQQLQEQFSDVSFDIQEAAPADILDLLYSRRINVGLLAADSVAQSGTHFLHTSILEDPYVLVVPEFLALEGVEDPKRDLSAENQAVLNHTIQFVFGSPHSYRATEWFNMNLPNHRIVAHVRSFETAIGLVRSGTGVCVAPSLATAGLPEGEVRRYRIRVPPRRLVALTLSQNARQEPVASLLAGLKRAGAAAVIPEASPTPSWLNYESKGFSL